MGVGGSLKMRGKGGNSRKLSVTAGGAVLCVGAVGAGGGGEAIGLSDVDGATGRDTCESSSGFSTTWATLELGHLCLQAVLQDLNFCPHASY